MRIDDRVEVRNQALTLAVPLPGSGLSLHYRSDRGPARRASYRARLPLSVPSGAEPIERWDVSVDIAGRHLTETVDGATSVYQFEWDGRDAQGDAVPGGRVAVLEARRSAADDTPVARRRVRLGRVDPRTIGLGGWTLSVHDILDPETGRVTPGGGGRTQRVNRIEGGPDAPVESTAEELLCPRQAGRFWSVFGPEGHRRVVDAVTGTVAWQFTYDADGRLATATDRVGRGLRIERAGSTFTISSPTRGLLSVAVDADGWASGMTTAAGSSAVFEVTDDRVVGWRDAESRHTSVSYDDGGRVASISRPAGPSFELSRRVDGVRTAIVQTSRSGREAQWSSDRLEEGGSHRENDCCGNTVPLTADRQGDELAISRPDGTRLTRRGRGTAASPTVTTVTTPGGITTLDELWIEVDPETKVLTETRVTNGRTRTTRIDPTGRRITTETPEGRAAWLGLDDIGRVVAAGVGDTLLRSISFDDAGRPSQTAVGAVQTTATFDPAGLPTELRTGLGETTRLEHDADGRLVAQTFADGATVRISYDATDDVIGVQPPGRPLTSFGYAAPGLLASMTFPEVDGATGVLRYSYDDDGNVTRIDRADGRSVELRWDLGGRNTEMRLIDDTGADGSFGFTYEPEAGRLIETSTPLGDSHRFGWDGHLPVSVEAKGVVNGGFSHTYDANQQIVATSITGTEPVTHTYDRDGWLTGIGPLVLERDDRGEIARRRLGNCTEIVERGADGRVSNRWVTIGDRELFAASFVYDAAGRVVSSVERIEGEAIEQQFEYDVVGNLVGHTHSDLGTTRFDYDENGNRVLTSGRDGEVAAEFDSRDRLVAHGDARDRHNLDGELEARTEPGGETRFTFDQLGRLVGVQLADGRTVRHHRDGFGRRIATAIDGEPVQRFLHAGAYPLAEVDGDGRPITVFLRRRTYGPPDALLRGDHRYLVVSDHVGSPRLVVDADSGAIVQRLDYDVWGRIVADTAPGFQPFGFIGGLVDPFTGLVHLGAREYDPATGRWLSTDPKIFLGGGTPNLYCYADNDPVNRWDPTGADVWRCESLSEIGWQGKLGLKHEWIKTDSVEAGLGPHPVKGGAETAVTDQSGYSEKRKDSTCEKIENVDEECVNARLATPNTAPNGVKFGVDLGAYTPWNQCQSVVEDVLSSCAGTSEFGDYDTYFESGELQHAQGKRWEDYSPDIDYTPDPGYTPNHEESSSLWD
ncbi:MAG: RHS repeat-associated core domain-containing protein [Acidimicrobiales bacterium]